MHVKQNPEYKTKRKTKWWQIPWNLKSVNKNCTDSGWESGIWWVSNIHQPFCPDQSSLRQRRKRLSGLIWPTEGCWHKKRSQREWVGRKKKLLDQEERGNSLRLLAVLCAWPPEFTQVHRGEGWNKLNMLHQGGYDMLYLPGHSFLFLLHQTEWNKCISYIQQQMVQFSKTSYQYVKKKKRCHASFLVEQISKPRQVHYIDGLMTATRTLNDKINPSLSLPTICNNQGGILLLANINAG